MLQEELQDHGGEGVEDCSSEDACDGAIRVGQAVLEAVDLGESGSEEGERDDWREELEDAQEALE